MTDLMPRSDLKGVRYDHQGRLLCKAKAKSSGRPCKQPAIAGGVVCLFHGGGAPQTIAAARRRLAAAADPAAAQLVREAETAEKSSDRIRASAEVLDRAGIGRHETHDVHQTIGDSLPWHLVDDERADEVRRFVAGLPRPVLEEKMVTFIRAMMAQREQEAE